MSVCEMWALSSPDARHLCRTVLLLSRWVAVNSDGWLSLTDGPSIGELHGIVSCSALIPGEWAVG